MFIVKSQTQMSFKCLLIQHYNTNVIMQSIKQQRTENTRLNTGEGNIPNGNKRIKRCNFIIIVVRPKQPFSWGRPATQVKNRKYTVVKVIYIYHLFLLSIISLKIYFGRHNVTTSCKPRASHEKWMEDCSDTLLLVGSGPN